MGLSTREFDAAEVGIGRPPVASSQALQKSAFVLRATPRFRSAIKSLNCFLATFDLSKVVGVGATQWLQWLSLEPFPKPAPKSESRGRGKKAALLPLRNFAYPLRCDPLSGGNGWHGRLFSSRGIQPQVAAFSNGRRVFGMQGTASRSVGSVMVGSLGSVGG